MLVHRRRAAGSARSIIGAVQQELLTWFTAHGRDLPWRRTRDPYAILVSEVMLQQTQVERVVPRYLRWLERWPTVAALAAAPTADVIREWQGLGYKPRAVNLPRGAGAPGPGVGAGRGPGVDGPRRPGLPPPHPALGLLPVGGGVPVARPPL